MSKELEEEILEITFTDERKVVTLHFEGDKKKTVKSLELLECINESNMLEEMVSEGIVGKMIQYNEDKLLKIW